MTKATPKLRIIPTKTSEAAKADEVQVDEVAAATWEDVVPRLLLLAMSRLARMTFQGRHGAVPPGAADAEDFVNEAIAKTMAGVRVWQKAHCTLFQHLAGIVVSDISHAANSAENRLTLADDGRDRPGGWPPDRADDRPGQEEQALWRSEQRKLLEFLMAIDQMLGRMAELILVEDVDASADLAQRLDVTVDQVANLRKRMKRAVRTFLLTDEEGGV